jgi:hypothetical protein
MSDGSDDSLQVFLDDPSNWAGGEFPKPSRAIHGVGLLGQNQ